MDFSLHTNTANVNANLLNELIENKDDNKIASSFNDGTAIETDGKKNSSTVSSLASNIIDLVNDSKKDSNAISSAKNSVSSLKQGDNFADYKIASDASVKDNTVSLKLQNSEGKTVDGTISFAKDGSKVLTVNENNGTKSVVFDSNGNKIQETSKTKTSETTTTYNNIDGKDIPLTSSKKTTSGEELSYYDKNGQLTRTTKNKKDTISTIDYEYNQNGDLIGSRTVSYNTSSPNEKTYTTKVFEQNSKGEIKDKAVYIVESDGAKRTTYFDIETGGLKKQEVTDKDGITTKVTTFDKNYGSNTQIIYNSELESNEYVKSVSRTKGVASQITCTQNGFSKFTPPEKSAPNARLLVVMDGNWSANKTYLYDENGNLIKDTASSSSSAVVNSKKNVESVGSGSDTITTSTSVSTSSTTTSSTTTTTTSSTTSTSSTSSTSRTSSISASDKVTFQMNIKSYLMGNNSMIMSDEAAVRAWDINGDGKVTISDATEYQKIAAELVENKENITSGEALKTATNIQRYLAELDTNITLSEYEARRAFDVDGDGTVSGNDITSKEKNKVITFHMFNYDDKYVSDGQTGYHTGEYTFKMTERMYNKIMKEFENSSVIQNEENSKTAFDKDGNITSYTREKLARIIQHYIQEPGEFDLTREEALKLLNLTGEKIHDNIIDIDDATFAQLGYPKYTGKTPEPPIEYDPTPVPETPESCEDEYGLGEDTGRPQFD